MSDRKWKAWWEVPLRIITMDVYPYKKVYRYGRIVEYGADYTTGNIPNPLAMNKPTQLKEKV